MESSKPSNCGQLNWLKFLQEALRYDPELSGPENHKVLLGNPTFLKVVLIAFLSMIGEKCASNTIEISRVIDFDCLKGISEDSDLTFKVIRDYSGRNYLQVTVRDQSFPLRKPGLAESGKRAGRVESLKWHSANIP